MSARSTVGWWDPRPAEARRARFENPRQHRSIRVHRSRRPGVCASVGGAAGGRGGPLGRCARRRLSRGARRRGAGRKLRRARGQRRQRRGGRCEGRQRGRRRCRMGCHVKWDAEARRIRTAESAEGQRCCESRPAHHDQTHLQSSVACPGDRESPGKTERGLMLAGRRPIEGGTGSGCRVGAAAASSGRIGHAIDSAPAVDRTRINRGGFGRLGRQKGRRGARPAPALPRRGGLNPARLTRRRSGCRRSLGRRGLPGTG
jgi:hypothetical protein